MLWSVRTLVTLLACTFAASIGAAQNKDPFAGKFATCNSNGPIKSESWRFSGMAKEYTKEFRLAGQKFEQQGKYSFKNDILTIEEYKKGSKNIDRDRKFKIKVSVNETGFEYLWKNPKGEEIPYTCAWGK